jgi:hypothetical protein
MDVPDETIDAAKFIKNSCGFNSMSEAYRNMLYRGRLTIIEELKTEKEQMSSIIEKQNKEKRIRSK